MGTPRESGQGRLPRGGGDIEAATSLQVLQHLPCFFESVLLCCPDLSALSSAAGLGKFESRG